MLVFAGCDGNGNGDGTDPVEPNSPVDPFTGTYRYERFDRGNNCTATRILTLLQTENTLTGTYDYTYACVGKCTANLVLSVTGTVIDQDSGTLNVPEGEGDCVGGGYEVQIATEARTYSLELSSTGDILYLDNFLAFYRQ